MQEAERFLRYVVPGLIFFIELFIYLLIAGDICLRQLIGIEQAHSVGIAVGIAVSGFLASGALGFLLGAIYYTVVWREWDGWLGLKLGADLRPVLKEVEGWLNLSCSDRRIEITDLSKRGAWRVVVAYFSARVETSEQMKGGIGMINRLSTLVNALGTTTIASLGAFSIFLIYDFSWKESEFSWQAAWAWGIGILILIVHYLNYKGVIGDYEAVCRSVLKYDFECEFYKKGIPGSPLKLYVFENDLKKKVNPETVQRPDLKGEDH